jgi:hypothetical protein
MKAVSFLISSCDSFSDCWKPYYHGLHKYWPDCPYNVLIVTNFKDSGDPSVKAIKVGEDKGWSHNTLQALNQIETPYVLYTHEDFWIQKSVSTQVITDYVALMERGKAEYIRLYPCPEPDYDFEFDDRLGTLAEEAPYRCSLQVALWRKSVFQELIVEGENAWQFEVQGTVRSRKYGSRFLSAKRFLAPDGNLSHFGIDYVCTAINKGKWSKAAKAYALREGLAIDFSNRPNETWWHDFVHASRFGTYINHICTMAVRAVKNPSKIISRLCNNRSNF